MSQRPDQDAASEYSSPDSFARLAANFEELRTKSPEAREAALQAMDAANPGITTALRALLAQHDEDPDEMAAPERVFARHDVEDALRTAGTSPAMPKHIGPYQIDRALGHGGMGSVYLGEHDDPDLRRRVAIKVLRTAHHDPQVLARFRVERRILAGLQHANIAALYDAGTTDDAQPFVAMEFVDGPDLVSYCNAERLTVERRLALFVKVCRAVAHAHRSLIVHRDLKPGNVLVTRDGEPKLLDFGIAKLLDRGEDEDDAALLPATHTGNMMLTPEYSSPEQVRGEPVTTSTDVYALGVMLYELLSGARAQQRDNTSMAELLRVVCEQSPPMPSTAVRGGPNDVPGHPEPRTRLSRRLDGDLDTIIATAMRKEPERRYATASALADDLERHLAGLPVNARPDTFAYRTRKFVGRHRLPVFATSVAVLLLIAFAIVTARDKRTIEEQLQTIGGQKQTIEAERDTVREQLAIIQDQNNTIRAERDEAVRQREVAQRIANFQESLFEMAGLDPDRAETLRARELLDRGALRIAGELADAPALRAPLELAMGRAYTSLGLYDDAEPLLLASEAAFREHEADSRAHREAQFVLAGLHLQKGRLARGEQLLRASWTPTTSGEPLPDLTNAARRGALAGWLRDQGRFDEALTLLEQARELAGEHLNAFQNRAISLDVAEASIRRDQGELQAARELVQQALTRSIASDGAHGPRQALMYRELAMIERQAEDLDAARNALERALAIDKQWSGDQHPDVDASLFSLAMIDIDRGDWANAEVALRDVLQRDEQRFGKEHAYPALSRSQLAMVLGHLGQIDEAEAMFGEALAVQERVLPTNHPELATTIANLGSLYNRLRRADEAATQFERALAIRQQIYPPEHPIVLTGRQQLAVVEIERGNLSKAEGMMREILVTRRNVLGPHSETAGSLLSLATCIARQNRPKEAIPLFEESVTMFRATLPAGHPTVARPLVGQALAQMRQGRPAAAEPLLREAQQIRRAALGERHFETLYTQFWRTRALAGAGETQAAQELGSATLEALQADLPGHGLTKAMERVMRDLAPR